MKKIFALLPESIGGRLTTSSIIDGFMAKDFDITVFDILKEDIAEATKKIKHCDIILSYDFSAIRFKKHLNLDIPSINYFSDVIQDSHSGSDWAEFYPALKKENNFVFYWDKKLTEIEKEKGEIKNLFYLPHFVNTDIYKNYEVKPEFDILFAGRLDTNYRLNTFLHLLHAFPSVEFGWFAIEKHFENALQRTDDESKKLLKKCYKGFVDNEFKMAECLNKTKLVINFNQQGISSLNYRTIQTYACEKLLISDYREEGKEYFKDDYIYYTTIQDMVNKIEFYLQHPQEAKEIGTRLRKKVEKDFSHIKGVEKIIEKAGIL